MAITLPCIFVQDAVKKLRVEDAIIWKSQYEVSWKFDETSLLSYRTIEQVNEIADIAGLHRRIGMVQTLTFGDLSSSEYKLMELPNDVLATVQQGEWYWPCVHWTYSMLSFLEMIETIFEFARICLKNSR